MGFNIVETLLGFTLLGAEWVLWLLLALSVVSIGIILERVLFFHQLRSDFATFSRRFSELMGERKFAEASKLCNEDPSLEAKVAAWGLDHRERGQDAMVSSMEGFAVGERHKLDRGLVVLGTLGNNAPFIGLFGTVIGIIKAFNDLAANPDGGPSVVMAGISEALVATAVGLLVAIPAVVAYNAFNRMVKRRMANVQALIRVVMTHNGHHNA